MNKYFFIPVLGLFASACGGNGNYNGNGGADGFTDTVYKPLYAAYTVLADRNGNRLVIPDTTGGFSYAAPLYIGQGAAPAGAGAIKSAARRIVCMSSTHVAMLSALGLSDRIVGVSGLQYISDPAVRRMRPADVGPAENVDYELLLSLDPDIVLLYGIGSASPMQSKLDELGIPYMYLNEFNEQSPLGKAEWLVAVAEICGIGDEGRNMFGSISARYDSLKNSIAAESGRKPKVMLNTPYNGVWFMPSGKSYMIHLIEDAGGSYVYPNENQRSIPVDLEEAYMLAANADVWINIDAADNVDQLKKQLPKFASIPAVVSRNLWSSDKRSTPGGGNDFYESAIVWPDRVLSDLHIIFDGGDSDSTYYYMKLK